MAIRARHLIAAAAFFWAAAPAIAAPTFYSTAAGPLGAADPVWTVAAGHGGFNDGLSRFNTILSTTPYGTAYHYADYGTLPFISNNSAGSNGGIGQYMYFVFRQTFDLTGYDASTADLKFQWGSDDVPSTGAVGWVPGFSLNGSALTGFGTSGAYALGNEVNLNSGFVSGLNTLDFYIEGNGLTDGLGLATVSFSALTAPVPEPQTYAMLLAGLGLLGFMARSRKQKAA